MELLLNAHADCRSLLHSSSKIHVHAGICSAVILCTQGLINLATSDLAIIHLLYLVYMHHANLRKLTRLCCKKTIKPAQYIFEGLLATKVHFYGQLVS